MTPDEWAAANRRYPKGNPHHGPRDPRLTPYVIPIERAIHARASRRIVAVFGTQMGKSELALDVIGHRLDTAPCRIGYVMPSDKILGEVVEPKIADMIRTTDSLRRKAGTKRQTKNSKTIAGVALRLVPAGSATALAADTLGLSVTDEVDKFAANVKGQGAVVGLMDRRGDADSAFVHFSTSSPSVGPVQTLYDEESELHFWDDVEIDDLQSPIWSMWQSGTRHHWAWPCPHCSSYFIPRFSCLTWDKPKNDKGEEMPSRPALAARTTRMLCEECAEPIYDTAIVDGTDQTAKEWMNERGRFVAPGQKVSVDGVVSGNPPDAWTVSYWVSGFASPFVPWGQRVAEYIEAVRARSQEDLQTVVNGFGELFSVGADEAPDWNELLVLRRDYRTGEIPSWVRLLTLTADVQKEGIYYVIRGWGHGESSALVKADFLMGKTELDDVWNALGVVLTDLYEDMPIKMALVDSGYRPGKKFIVPDHMVYKFCRRYPNVAFPTKGASNPMRKPILANKLDVKIDGKTFKKGIELRTLDTGHFKRWLTNKLRWPVDQMGMWHLPIDVPEEYLRQMVSEVEIRLASGKTKWIQKIRDNHYFDCESMQGAIAMMLNLRLLRAGTRMKAPRRRVEMSAHAGARPAEIEAAERAPTSEDQPAASAARRARPKRRPNESIW